MLEGSDNKTGIRGVNGVLGQEFFDFSNGAQLVKIDAFHDITSPRTSRRGQEQ